MADTLSADQKKDLHRRFSEMLQTGNLNGLAELIDVDEYQDMCPGVTPGWVDFETARNCFSQVYAAIPGAAMKLKDIVLVTT